MTPGSRPWVVRSLREWAISIGQGMALVTFRSGRARDETLRDLEREFHERQLSTEILECGACSAQEFLARIERSAADVLFVLDPDSVLFGRGDDHSAFWVNFHRETLAAHPGVQFWWMLPGAAIRFGQQLPDLSRFFLYREELTEKDDSTRERFPEFDRFEGQPGADPERYRAMLQRALRAAANPEADRLRIWTELGLPALKGLASSHQYSEAAAGLQKLETAVGTANEVIAYTETEPTREHGMALLVLAIVLPTVGRQDESSAAAAQAVRTFRRLAERAPDETILANLARALNILGLHQALERRGNEGTALLKEALAIARDLARQNPARFSPLLAGCLKNLADAQAAAGQGEEALISAEESVALYRDLVASAPKTFLRDLGLTLVTLAYRQRDLGRRREAARSVEEIQRIYQELSTEGPQAALAVLSASLMGEREE